MNKMLEKNAVTNENNKEELQMTKTTMNATTENNKEEINMTTVNPMEKEMKELMKFKKAELCEMILNLMNEAVDYKIELANLKGELEAKEESAKEDKPVKESYSSITEATAIVGGVKREVIIKQVSKNKIVGTVGDAHFEWDRKYNLPKVWVPNNKYKTAQVMKRRDLVADFIRVALGKEAKGNAAPKKEVAVAKKTSLKKEAVVSEPVVEEVIVSDELMSELYA